MKEISLSAYVDSYAVFTETCPMNAVLLLLALYWIFKIEFFPKARPSFMLISTAILKNEMPVARVSKNSAVNSLLKQLNL